ncbi:unnamed protein product [Zymoseptoria tritici ST99CH_3D7]|uniref:Rhodopsin domain-containing protein n=1 Tax=Zymoseptoria tritici (strain ST99CH_3D7) TaxID=1276538 RepID=A0A1X7RHC1_ZYMT9|nr:unnamed protein product [Zymoseptoria tritici ST99CH_3D7]
MPQRQAYGDVVAFTISLCLCFTVCIALLRVWIRRSAYGVDDVVIGIATLVSLGHTGSSYAALASGLGGKWTTISSSKTDLAKLNQATTAGIVLFFLALYLSKCAMLSFLVRITKTPSQILTYRICAGVVGLFGILSIVISTAGCPARPASSYYWAFRENAGRCPSLDIRWQILTAFDVVTEIGLLALPIQLVWNLQMPRSKKAMITVAFWIRLPALAFSMTRNYYTLQLPQRQSDPGLDGALVSIWLEIELAYALAASTLSALKAFMESFDSGFGLGFTRGKGEDTYGMSDVTGSSGHTSKNEKTAATVSNTRQSLTPSRRDPAPEDHVSPVAPISRRSNASPLRLRPERGIAYRTNISSEPFGCVSSWRSGSSNDSESSGDDMVIHRETAYDVQHDEAPMLPGPEQRA